MTRLLLVDDDESNMLTMSALLESEGIEVATAKSLEAGRRLVAADDARYDLVLLDYRLQDGRGTELVALIRSRLPRAQVILSSGDAEGARETCVDAVHLKGSDFGLLLTAIGRMINTPEP